MIWPIVVGELVAELWSKPKGSNSFSDPGVNHSLIIWCDFEMCTHWYTDAIIWSTLREMRGCFLAFCISLRPAWGQAQGMTNVHFADVAWVMLAQVFCGPLQQLQDLGSIRGTTWLYLLVSFWVLTMALSDLCRWVHVLHLLWGPC